MARIGVLHSLIRPDEKMLLRELASRRDVEMILIDVRKLHFNLGRDRFDVDVAIERCINHSRAVHAMRLFEGVIAATRRPNANAEANYRMAELYVSLGQRDQALARLAAASLVAPSDGLWSQRTEEYLNLLR